MTIVCYINKLYKGGAERVLANIANELYGRGYQIVFVTDYASENEYFLQPEIKRFVFDGQFVEKTLLQKIGQYVRRIFRLRKIVKAYNADVVISFIKEVNQRAILATTFLQTKNIISVRIDPKRAYRSVFSVKIANFLYRQAGGCVFQTKEAADFYSDKVRKHSRIILNPISNEFFQVDSEPMRDPTIVTCGRLTEQKNHKLLIDAFNSFHKTHPETRLLIYGEGPLRKELAERITGLNLQDCAKLMGRCNDVPHTIKYASMFVLSSDYEGLPNALMEAMVLGLPVISTDCDGGGAKVLINDHEDGLLIPCNDAVKLSEAMTFLFDHKEEAKAMGIKAKEKAKAFTTQSVVDQWEDYIHSLVKN